MKMRGFTLMELLVALAIVGIISAFAYPSYRNSAMKGHRVDAEQTLMRGAQQLERLYTTNNCYTTVSAGACSATAPSATTVFGVSSVASGSTTYYTLNVEATADTYTLTATPSGGQASESCGTLSITQAGVKTPTTAGCW